jgi:hypothetical protein
MAKRILLAADDELAVLLFFSLVGGILVLTSSLTFRRHHLPLFFLSLFDFFKNNK